MSAYDERLAREVEVLTSNPEPSLGEVFERLFGVPLPQPRWDARMEEQMAQAAERIDEDHVPNRKIVTGRQVRAFRDDR